MTSKPSQMQALASGLPSPSEIIGELGGSSRVGNRWMESKTLAGQKLLASSFSSGQSLGLDTLADTLKSMVITRGSSKGGGTSEAKIQPQIESSNKSMPSLSHITSLFPFTQHTSPVSAIQQTLLPEASILHPVSCFPDSNYQLISAGSLLTRPSLSLPPRSASSERIATPPSSPNALATFSRVILPMNPVLLPTLSTKSAEDNLSAPNSRSFANIHTHDASSFRTPHRYLTNLTPILSDLRPHFRARDRLRLWKPTFVRSPEHLIEEIMDDDLDHLISVINSSWQPATRETYGAGLLVFHVFCDLRLVPETFHCPADPLLIFMLTFISSCAGSYSRKTLANYFYAVCAWHTLHGAPWCMSLNTTEMKAALDGAAILAPPSSKRLVMGRGNPRVSSG